jgi:hypothetical protein
MIDTGAGLRVRRRLLLVLLVCIALPLVGGCSSDPECIAAPFLPECFDDDDEEEKTDDTATQTRVRVNARTDDIDTTMVALRHTLIAVHEFPDERVFFATGNYVDEVERVNGQWKIVHRDKPITPCALLEAFPVG